jgi:hypothetical protein
LKEGGEGELEKAETLARRDLWDFRLFFEPGRPGMDITNLWSPFDSARYLGLCFLKMARKESRLEKPQPASVAEKQIISSNGG